MALGYRPPVYFWIAEYSDGSALPQFDPETGKENLFKDVDQSKLKRFGWYPFSPKLAQKIFEASGILVVPTSSQPYSVEIEEGQKLVALRRNAIAMHSRGRIERGKTVYLLGIEGEKILHINEDGNVEISYS